MINFADIIEGHTNEFLGLNKELANRRIAICKECPIYSEKLGGICNHHLWINPKTNDVSIKAKAGYIRGCNCRIKAKATLQNQKCPAGKW